MCLKPYRSEPPAGLKKLQPAIPQPGFVPVHENLAAIDIASAVHYVSVPEDRDERHVRTFNCLTPGLQELADWLRQCRIERVVMEATGVYFVPVFEFLQDSGFTVRLVRGGAAKDIAGKKTDVADAVWLRAVYSCGLIRDCFVPDKELSVLRWYWRLRADQVKGCAEHTLRMHKALELMNVQLHKVLSDVTGMSGMAIIRAIIAGERDPSTLANLVKSGVKHSRDTFVAALTGHYRDEHVFALSQAVEAYDFFQRQIRDCDAKLAEALANLESKQPPPASGSSDDTAQKPPTRKSSGAVSRRRNQPHFDLKLELARVVGVDVTVLPGIDAMTAQTVFSECGYDLGSFETEHKFSSFLGLSPNNRITGGKVKSRRTKKVVSRAATALRVSAQSLLRGNSALAAFCRRMRARVGPAKAITATAHKLAVLLFRMVRYGQDYVDHGQQQYEEQYRKQQRAWLLKQARRLGMTVVDTATGSVVEPIPGSSPA
jgi:transposase